MVRNRLSVLLLFAVLTSTGASQSTPTATTTLRLRGTIEKYEASTRILSVATSNGTVRFPLTSTARIRQGGREIDVSVLEKLSGYRADVHYSESGGHKTVESV